MVISEFIDSHSAATAAGTRIHALREFFTDRGWDVLLVVPRDEESAEETSRNDGRVRRLTTYETRRQQLQSPAAVIAFPLSIREYVNSFREFRPDIVVISGYSPFILMEPLLVAKLLRIPVVFDVLDSWILLGEFHPGRIRNWLRRSIERFALSRGNLVVGVTKTQLGLLADRYRLNSQTFYKAAVSTKAYDYLVAGIPILFLGPSDSEQAEFVRKYGIGRVCETPEELAQEAAALLSDEKALGLLRKNAEAAASSLAWTQVLKPFYEHVAALLSLRDGEHARG